MKTVKLRAFRDESTGELGLGLVGMSSNYGEVNSATEGLLIAHDVIEHVNGVERIGSIADELEALGAIWYVRGQHGELNRDGAGSHYTIAENIASDITRMYRDWFYTGCPQMPYQARTRASRLSEQNILDTLSAAENTWIGEFDEDDKLEARKRWPDYRNECLVRMRVGFTKARRKWERKGRYAANSQFWAIAEACSDTIKQSELFEGAEYTLRYGNGEATLTSNDDY